MNRSPSGLFNGLLNTMSKYVNPAPPSEQNAELRRVLDQEEAGATNGAAAANAGDAARLEGERRAGGGSRGVCGWQMHRQGQAVLHVHSGGGRQCRMRSGRAQRSRISGVLRCALLADPLPRLPALLSGLGLSCH